MTDNDTSSPERIDDWDYDFNPQDLLSENESFRRWAVIAISRKKLTGYETLLLEMLAKEASEHQRRHIVRALGNLLCRPAIPHLLKLLQKGTGLIVGDAAEALGKLKANEARADLIRQADSGIQWVAQKCRWALKQIGGAKKKRGQRELWR